MTEYHRKWMRGIAVFFLAISFVELIIGLATWLTAGRGASDGALLTALAQPMLVFIFAGMMWHGGRLGTLLLVITFLTLSGLAIGNTPGGKLFLLIRLGIYASIAIYGLWHTHRYHAECLIDDAPIGGYPAVRWGGFMVMILPLGIAGTGVAMTQGKVSTAVLPAYEIDAKHYAWMTEQNFLLADERVQYFYSEGLFSISEGGNLLTNRYVGSWWRDEENALTSYWLPIGEVCKVETIDVGGPYRDGVYNIHGAGEDNWVQIWLSTEDEGHTAFLSRLNYLNKRNQHPFVRNACDEGIDIDREGLALANGIEPGIVSGDLVEQDQRDWLSAQRYLRADETIISFYSYGTYDIDTGGSMLTDKYFGGWYQSQGQAYSAWAELGEICSIEQVQVGDLEAGEDAKYKITYGEDSWYTAQLSSLAGADEALIQDLTNRNEAHKTDNVREACKSWGKTEIEDV